MDDFRGVFTGRGERTFEQDLFDFYKTMDIFSKLGLVAHAPVELGGKPGKWQSPSCRFEWIGFEIDTSELWIGLPA